MLIAKGLKSDYSIIYPSNPTDPEQNAVNELKSYLFKITGAQIPTYRDDRHKEAKEIVVGYTNRGGYTDAEKEELGEEGFIIKSVGEKIFIIGAGKRGVLYGVYTFLEEYCGCRFYTNDFEKVPTARTLDIPKISKNKQIPVFKYRNPYWYSVCMPGISVKLKINGEHGRWAALDRAIPESWGGAEAYTGGFCHTMPGLNEQSNFWAQICMTDEDVYKRVIKNVRRILSEHPEAKIFSITQGDGLGQACQCEKCRAINEPEGSGAATNLLFVNRIAEELEDEYPNVLFDTFAYTYTRFPPKTIKPRKNVQIRMCTIECCNRHSISVCGEHPGYQQESTMEEYFRGWADISDSLACWNYVTNFTNASVIFPNWEAMLKDEKFFADHKVVSVFEQGNLAGENGEFSELRAYILSRTLWDPYMSEKKYWAYIREFIDDFYGKAGQYIYDYLKLTLDCSKKSHFNVYFDNPCNNVFKPGIKDHQKACHAFADEANALFDNAEKAVKNDPFALSNVRRSRIQLYDYIDFMLRADRDAVESEAEKKKISKKIIANNAIRENLMRTYDVYQNHEFSDIRQRSEVDLSDYALRW